MATKLISEQLKKVVSISNRFVPLRPSLPVLANVYLKATKTKLILVATNLESSIRVEIPAVSEEWEITTPAKILGEFLNSTKDKEVNLSLSKENLKVSSGNLEANIAGIAASEFPKVPENKSEDAIAFKQKELQEAVSSVAFAASVDEGKPVLNGILIKEEDDKTILVATDGYRLAKKILSKKYKIEQTIVPARIFPEALRVAAEMEETEVSLSISENDNQLLLFGESFLIATRLIDGVYPNFNQIIPNKFVTEVLVSKENLIAAIKATAVFARDSGNVVKLSLGKNQEIKLAANTVQVGESSASVVAKITGDELKIAFNSHYLLDGLNSIAEENIKISFSGVLSPAQIVGENEKGFMYIVMPVKAQN